MADDKPHSFVNGRPESTVNSPTIYNVRFLYKLTWNGKYDSLETHIDVLIKNPKVMASSWELATKRLSEVASYRDKFAGVFHDGLTASNVRSAILEYERSLVTPNAPFARYLRGDAQAISPDAKQGYAMFKSYGCTSCHQGMAIGGNVFERFGVLRDLFADRGRFDNADLGGRERSAAAGAAALGQRLFFDKRYSGALTVAGELGAIGDTGKVACATCHSGGAMSDGRAPFTVTLGRDHAGQLADLAAVVSFYNAGGGEAVAGSTKDPLLTPLSLSDTEQADLVEFLKTLSGDPLPSALLEAP